MNTPKTRKRWWLWLTAVLVLCAVCVIATLLWGPPAPPPADETDPTVTTPLTTTHTTAATTAAPTTTVTVATTDRDETTVPPATTTTASTTVTTKVTTTTKVPITTTTNVTTTTTTNVTTTTTATTTAAPTTTTTTAAEQAITWYYRAATFADYDRELNGVLLADAIVVTGFDRIPQSGEYRIPATIDGRTVVAVDMSRPRGLAFDSDSVCQTVKTLYLPPAVTRVADDLLTDCVHLSDLYIGADEMYLPASALPPLSARTTLLTLHTPALSWCTYGSSYFKTYCASPDNGYRVAHAEWNVHTAYAEVAK